MLALRREFKRRNLGAYLSHNVGLGPVGDRGSRRAEGGEGGDDLGGVLDGSIVRGISASHEGGRSSDDTGVTHFCWLELLD